MGANEKLRAALHPVEPAERCSICHGSGWTGSRFGALGVDHWHCPCGAPCAVTECTSGLRP